MSSTPDALQNDGSIGAAATAFEALLTGEQPTTEDVNEAPESEEIADEPVEDIDDDEELVAESIDEAEESDDDETEEQIEEAPGDIQTFSVRVDGEEVTGLTLDDLIRGYSRTEDYTRKTQALSEERKEAQLETEKAKTERMQYAQVLEQMLQHAQAQAQPPADWDKLRAEDPVAFATQYADYQRSQEQAKQIEAEQIRLGEIERQEHDARLQEVMSSERDSLINALPSWSDETVAATERKEITDWGLHNGYTHDQLNGIVNHVDVLTLRKAMMFDKLQAKQADLKPVMKRKTPTLKPGSANSVPKPKTNMQKAQRRLAKTGSVRDAAAVFEQMLKN